VTESPNRRWPAAIAIACVLGAAAIVALNKRRNDFGQPKGSGGHEVSVKLRSERLPNEVAPLIRKPWYRRWWLRAAGGVIASFIGGLLLFLLFGQ
jgi:hypothetical protein